MVFIRRNYVALDKPYFFVGAAFSRDVFFNSPFRAVVMLVIDDCALDRDYKVSRLTVRSNTEPAGDQRGRRFLKYSKT